MPNWCSNELTIKGEKAELQKLIDFVGAPYERQYAMPPKYEETETTKFSNPVFAFWNVIRPDEELMESYIKSEAWYQWNINHWGTKWDVANVDGENSFETYAFLDKLDEGEIGYSLWTAWSPCIPIIEKLSIKFPTLEFKVMYVETGMEFWGISEYANGELIEERYEEELSHKAYVEMGDVGGCNCAEQEDEEYFYADCPRVVSEEKVNS
jgi:hypothetical protein